MDINELALSICQEFVERALLRASVGSAAVPHGIPAGLLHLVWANPFSKKVLYGLMLFCISLGFFPHQLAPCNYPPDSQGRFESISTYLPIDPDRQDHRKSRLMDSGAWNLAPLDSLSTSPPPTQLKAERYFS
jgi:hypothetical protein